MKKHLLFLFAALLPLVASAEEVEIDGIWYNLTTETHTAEVTYYKGDDPYQGGWYSGSITIPATVTYDDVTYSVTSIGQNAFEDCNSLTSITIPEGVTSIGERAFAFCSSLTDITIPKSVTSIEYAAFAFCSSLTDITLPEGVTNIRGKVFESCSSLTAITIPGNVTSIESEAFYGCSNLTSITIPEGVTSIGDVAFSGTPWYNNQPDGVVYINNILYNYKGTMPENTSIEVKDGTKGIADGAFSGCSSLIDITIPEGVTSIGSYAFYYCTSLTTITIPESVTSIEWWAFYNCRSLTTITCHAMTPPTVGGSLTFSGVTKSIPVYVPAGSAEDYKAAEGWSEFTNIQPLAQAKVEVNGIWYNLDEDTKQAEVTYKGSSYDEFTDEYSGSITIPTTVTHEGVSYNVTSIEDRAFYYCTSLTDITIPESVTSIGSDAFSMCRSLTAITLSEGLTSIGNYAFYDCVSLTTITLPKSLTSIGDWAFYWCIGLTTITCNIVTPPAIAANFNTFSNVSKSIPVYVPAGSVEAYQSAEGWGKFTNILPLAQENDFTLTVSSAGYATLFLDYAAKIPNNVKAYIATSVEGDRLMMTRVTGVLPAETGVIVRAEAGEYTFAESEDTPANVEGNLLSGSSANKTITTESGYKYYVLAKKNDVVAMYHPQLTDGKFTNMANKAYLALKADDLGIFDEETNTEDEGGQLSNRLRFDFGGTTDIEMATDNGGQTTEIYDLHGRRVTNIEKPGIYIVGGKKVVIK